MGSRRAARRKAIIQRELPQGGGESKGVGRLISSPNPPQKKKKNGGLGGRTPAKGVCFSSQRGGKKGEADPFLNQNSVKRAQPIKGLTKRRTRSKKRAKEEGTQETGKRR